MDESGYSGLGIFGKIALAVGIIAVIAVASVLLPGVGGVIATGALMGASGGFVGGGVSGAISASSNGKDIWEGIANGALTGTIVGAISGAVAASPLGVYGQMAVNGTLNAGSYTVNNLGNWNVGDFLLNTGIGIAAGKVGGAGWMNKGSTFATDLALNGMKETFANMGFSVLREFADPILKATIIGGSGILVDLGKATWETIRGD